MTQGEKSLCEDWVKAHVSSWQVLNRAQWKYKFHPKTIIRFIEEASMREDEVKLLLEYLSSDDCVSTLSLYDQSVTGYKPTKVWYEASNRVYAGIRGVRLYHALSDDNGDDDGPYVIEDGCAWKVEHTFVWGATEAPTVEPSTSGVMHKIEALRRDEETGLFSYVKETRTRVQQNIPEYVREVNIFAEVKESASYGVKADAVESTGKQASASGGVLVERKITKNEDCTSDVLNIETTEQEVTNAVVIKTKHLHAVTTSVSHRNQAVALTDDTAALKVGESRKSQKTPGGLYDNTHEQVDEEEVGEIGTDCEKTIFAHESRNTKNQNDKPVQCTTDAGSGHIYSKSARQTEYGTWNVTDTDRQELAVSGAVKSYRKTLHGVIETTEDKNQEAAVNGEGLKVGEARESKKTPGGLYDNTKSLVATEAAGEVSRVGTENNFIKEESVLINELEMVDTTPSFETGTIIRKVSALNNDGTADNETRTTTAKFAWLKYDWTDNRGKHTRFWYRNSPRSWVGADSSATKKQESTGNENNNMANEPTANEPTFAIPLDVDTVDSHEVLNEFNLYDGAITYSYLNNKGNSGDYSGDTTGAPVVLYEEGLFKPKNIRYVKKYEIQMTIYRGFNIAQYDDSASKANIARTTPGVLRVKSLSKSYKDSAGTLKKDWAQVDLQAVGDWEKYDRNGAHKDIRIVSPDAILGITQALLDGLR